MDIQELRGNIDRIDRQLIELFSQRMETSSMIAAYKKENRLPVYDPAREREILVRVSAMAGPELEDYTRVLFQTLFDLSRSYQRSQSPAYNELTEAIERAKETTPPLFPQRALVACQGVEGAYSQLACDKLFSAPSIMSRPSKASFRRCRTAFAASGSCRSKTAPTAP